MILRNEKKRRAILDPPHQAQDHHEHETLDHLQ
jgi:hypothetical protein